MFKKNEFAMNSTEIRTNSRVIAVKKSSLVVMIGVSICGISLYVIMFSLLYIELLWKWCYYLYYNDWYVR